MKWITPKKRESLSSYISRLIADQIDSQEEICLVGLSFGGIVCQEIAKQIPCKKVIIISSVKDAKEMGKPYYLLRRVRIDKIIPNYLLKWGNVLTCIYFFGVENAQESKLLRQIILDTDRSFTRWAIDQLLRWDNHQIADHSLIHIHGKRDKIFPIGNIKNCMSLPGGHLMVIGRANEVSRILIKAFAPLS